MRKIKFIFVFFLVPYVLLAESFTVTVASYNKAVVTGDVPQSIQVTYHNDATSHTRITAGNTATLTITGIPECTITGLSLLMHSNKTSGAGSMSCMLNEVNMVSVRNSPFTKWHGAQGYTTQWTAIPFSGAWSTPTDGTLTLILKATANSLYFSELVVTYTPTPPRPHTVIFDYSLADGTRQTMSRTESLAGLGVAIPACPVTELSTSDNEWIFAGWTTSPLRVSSTEQPAFFRPDQQFYPSHQTTLFAVYRTLNDTHLLVQNTSYVSGEYALVMAWLDKYVMMTGSVANKTVASLPCTLSWTDDSLRVLATNVIPSSARYYLDFEGDSVSITSSKDGTSVGHQANALVSNNARWYVRPSSHHTLELSHGRIETATSASGMILRSYTTPSQDICFAQVKTLLDRDYDYFFLFPTAGISTITPRTYWSSYPLGDTGIEDIISSSENRRGRKCLLNGHLIIRNGDNHYTVTGTPITH